MDRKGLAILILVGIILVMFFSPAPRSNFSDGMNGHPKASNSGDKGHMDFADYNGGGDGGAVSSASLIPREVVQTEDFGQFSPDTILSGQNFLDPRSQIGYPETIGGAKRNGNKQIRSEPMNPRTPVSIFNLSTIAPDTMRPKFEISPEYQ